MKRKALSADFYTQRERLNGMVFTLSLGQDCRVQPVSYGDHTYPKDDIIYYGLHLEPPVPLESMLGATLHVFYSGQNPVSTGSFNIALLETLPEKDDIVDLENTFCYVVEYTHSLRLTEDQKSVSIIHFTVNNVQLSKRNSTPHLELLPDMDSFFYETFGEDRFVAQPFYPADPAVMDALKRVNARDVPQRTPFWFKLRGEVTGTKAYKACGFYPDSSEFDEKALRRMRFGRVREDFICAVYMDQRPHVKVEMVGCCPVPDKKGWGASPDGIVHDETMTWDLVPDHVRAEYEKDTHVDICRGVLEIKGSQGNCNMQAYYYPQLYLEMMSVGAVWTDLVRYSEQRVSDNGTWSTLRECRVYRVYRHRKTETKLINLVNTYLRTPFGSRLQLFKEERYERFRTYLKECSSSAEYAKLEVSEPLFEQYQQYVEDAQKTAPEEPEMKRPAILRNMSDRQLEIFRMAERNEKPTQEFVVSCLKQIKSLAELVEYKISE